MTPPLKIQSADRELFLSVFEMVFRNPFSAEWRDLYQSATGGGVKDDQKVPASVIEKVHARVDELRSRRRIDMRLYHDADKPLVQSMLLFDLFHRHLEAMDRLIVEQEHRGAHPCPVAFADEALGALIDGGFSVDEAERYFAFIYQMRRAYYFISRGMVGRSPSMEKLRCDLWNNIFTYDRRWYEDSLWNRMADFSTLLIGETGTGKAAAAAAIGRSGFIPFDRKRRCFARSFTTAFIPVNLSQFPESLIDSELFGHAKGAMAGTVETHQGVFSRCRPHGIVFLDEIGAATVSVQIKLLKVLQDRTFTMVGSRKERPFQGRLVAATDKPLDEMRRRGSFRDDFYYRLCCDVIQVPSLRQQIGEDPGCLTEILSHTLRRVIGQSSGELEDIVLETLKRDVDADYPWPGNVRELEQAVRRVLLRHDYDGDSHWKSVPAVEMLQQGIEMGAFDAPALLSTYCAMLYDRFGTYEKVSRITRLDPRTVKKYVDGYDRHDPLSRYSVGEE